MTISVIILAAGKGTRMKSDLPKVMHKIVGQEMINMVIDEVENINPLNTTIVVSEELKEGWSFNSNPLLVVQKERKGTGHAVITALEQIRNLGDKVIILYGDTPLISQDTLNKMSQELNEFDLCILGFEETKENKYGRLVVDKKNNLQRIVEFKDASDEERKITLCNSGVIAVRGNKINELLKQITNDNAAKEYYLTDIVGLCESKTYLQTSYTEVLGVNSKIELANLEKIKQSQLRKYHMENGVTLIDPSSVYFAFDTKIAKNSIIYPNVFFGPKVNVGENVEIKSFSHIENAVIKNNCSIGPFARIRPESVLEEDVKIGNFVEVKKSNLKSGAKVSHLSYIGDSEIGKNSNIGAGTITCNYDGYNKFKTKIGEDVFVGSNTALVAPVEIRDKAVIGAGSVITKNVNENDLAVARSKQINLNEGAKKFHKDKSKK